MKSDSLVSIMIFSLSPTFNLLSDGACLIKFQDYIVNVRSGFSRTKPEATEVFIALSILSHVVLIASFLTKDLLEKSLVPCINRLFQWGPLPKPLKTTYLLPTRWTRRCIHQVSPTHVTECINYA